MHAYSPILKRVLHCNHCTWGALNPFLPLMEVSNLVPPNLFHLQEFACENECFGGVIFVGTVMPGLGSPYTYALRAFVLRFLSCPVYAFR